MAQKIPASPQLFKNKWRNKICKCERSEGVKQMKENQVKAMMRKNICNMDETLLSSEFSWIWLCLKKREDCIIDITKQMAQKL